MEAGSRVISAKDYRRERWKNGAGWTREILRFPEHGNWDWRLSIAEIEQDAPFSCFEGIERELVLLQGNGLRMRFDDGQTVELQPPYERIRFAGERAVRGELLDGPTQDFNLMWRRQAYRAELLHRPLVGTMLFFAEPTVHWLVHLLAGQAGQAGFGQESALPIMQAGDTAVLMDDQRTRHALEGGGELLAIRLQRLQAADAPMPGQRED